jgi:ribosomal peptide maturation radical SAM protein 1
MRSNLDVPMGGFVASSSPSHVTNPPAADIPVMQESTCGIPVALVCMPWASIRAPSLALPILKKCVQKAGFVPDLHYLHLQFAQRLGFREYEKIASETFLHAEWFFSQALFGPTHLNEIQNTWSHIRSARGLSETVMDLVDDSEELCIKIVQEVPGFIDDCVSQIAWATYMAVGFTSTFAQSLASLLLAKRIKEKFPHVKIVFGGANVDSEMGVEFIRGFEWIDYVVHGEAEESFPTLLSNIAADRVERIPGISMRNGTELILGHTDVSPLTDMNESPVPDYSDYLRALDRSGFRKVSKLRLFFESSRGCWWGAKHHCTFCGLNRTAMAYRKKDPDRVYSEILELAQKYQCLTLFAADNILPLEYFKQLLPKLAATDIDLQLFYEVKANLSREQIKTLREAGVKSIQPGIESFSSRILGLMRKGVTAIQNIQLLKWCSEYEIVPCWNILCGFPGEVPEDYKDFPSIFRLIAHLHPPASIVEVTFDRFSPYFFDRENFRLKLKPLGAYRFIFPESRVNLERIAYHFEGDWEGQLTNMQVYISPLVEEWQIWKKQIEARTIYCYYDKGPDYLIIYDNRPRMSGAPVACRRLYLSEQISAVYLFCDEHHSFQAISEAMRNRYGNDLSPEKIQGWLDQLVFHGLMFRENDRYLSLAVRNKPIQLPINSSVSVRPTHLFEDWSLC